MVRVRKFTKDEDYRVMWKSIRGERRVVLDCPPDMLVDVLNSSTEFGQTGLYNVSSKLMDRECRCNPRASFPAHIPDQSGDLHR